MENCNVLFNTNSNIYWCQLAFITVKFRLINFKIKYHDSILQCIYQNHCCKNNSNKKKQCAICIYNAFVSIIIFYITCIHTQFVQKKTCMISNNVFNKHD